MQFDKSNRVDFFGTNYAEIDDYYADIRYERIAILNALGAYYSYLGKIETKQREKEEHFILATQYYNKASRIDMHEPSTWVGKGELHIFLCICGLCVSFNTILSRTCTISNIVPARVILDWVIAIATALGILQTD